MRTYLLLLSLIFSWGCQHDHSHDKVDFQVSVDTDQKPWSHLKFRNDPDNFQFAIVSDRTGGARPGVFPKALKRLNSLEPEFVITVGDLISANRHTKDEATAHMMWEEMEEFVSYLDMPFFYLAGNHDNGTPLLSKVWKERFGVERYHFVYKDVLFLCMNAQDDASFKAIIKKEQQDWAKKVLAENKDVRWTFVFIHQPVWMYEEGLPINEIGPLEPRDTGWQVIEDALKGREHTVFAGHVHQYVKYKQEAPNTNYYSLATTGGGSRMRGADFGEFDHAMWVTMTENGPKLANLLIDGILPEDVNDEKQELFRGLVTSKSTVESVSPYKMKFELGFDNQLDIDLKGHWEWDDLSVNWLTNLNHYHVDVKQGERFSKTIVLSYKGKPENILPLPKLHFRLKGSDDRYYVAQIKPSLEQIEGYFKQHGLTLPLEYKKQLNKKKKKK